MTYATPSVVINTIRHAKCKIRGRGRLTDNNIVSEQVNWKPVLFKARCKVRNINEKQQRLKK